MPTKGQGWQEDIIPKAYLSETDERSSLSTTYLNRISEQNT